MTLIEMLGNDSLIGLFVFGGVSESGNADEKASALIGTNVGITQLFLEPIRGFFLSLFDFLIFKVQAEFSLCQLS